MTLSFSKTNMKTLNIIHAGTRAALSTSGRAKSRFLSVAAKTFALTSGLAMAASIASAQSFYGLGYLTNGTESYARDVSNNGVVVGLAFIPPANSPTTGYRAFDWTLPGGMMNLGTLPGGTYSTGRAVSADGSTAAGWSGTLVGSQQEVTHACIWTGAGVFDLGSAGAGTSSAYGISADSSVVVGYSYINGQKRAVRWTMPGGGMTNLGVPAGGGWVYSTANGVSGNGSVVVGSAAKSNGNSLAWRWSGGVMATLGTLPRGAFSEAVGASTDGSVVVGSSDSRSGSRAFRWQSGVMTDLGVLPGQPYSYGRAVSGDGSRIVGYCGDGTTELLPSGSQVYTGRAFYWTSATRMVDLNTYLAQFLPPGTLDGWTLREARGISADGKTITGWGMHNGLAEAWVASLP